jgi:hypothetical protein
MDQYRLDMENELKKSPINDAAILSHAEKVIARHTSYVKRTQKSKRLRLGYAVVLFVGLIAIAITSNPLSETIFHQSTSTDSEIPLVEGDGIRIMPEEFELYKANIKEVNNQPNATPMTVSDEQIIDNLIIDKLLVQYAKKFDIVVSPSEIDKEIAFQRDSLEKAPNDNPIRELMANRIKRSGLSEDAFWDSELVRTNYENSILVGKMFTKLIADGTIKRVGDGSEFAKFREELLAKNKQNLKINWSTVKNS